MRVAILALVSGAMALFGCGGDGASTGANGFQEMYDQGLTKYVGAFEPDNTPEPVDGVKTFEFGVPSDPAAEPRGPLCLRGTQYTVDTREGSSDALVIFLQGGGACWEDFCSAVEETGSISASGILNPELAGNPVADWDLVYLPYCDGSLFAGDVDRMLPASVIGGGSGGGPSMGYQRGLQNLTAALDVAIDEYPSPSRILLAGVSGGAFGTITALPLVRFYYPDTEILLFNDSGVGIAKAGDPAFINDTLLAGWNASSLVPASCTDCTSNGHATRLIEWELGADDNFKMSALSFSADSVIATAFLLIPSAEFTAALLSETGRTAMLFEDRYKRFIPVGNAHTTLLLESSDGGGGFIQIGSLQTEVDGVDVLQWLTAMVEGTDGWVDLVDPSLL